MESTKILFGFYIIFVILHGANFLSEGDITADSVVIFQKFYDGVADRTERIITEENINAIRTEDVSGNNGDAVISYFSDRNIVLVFFNEDGNGYNISLELYTNRRKDDADGGAAAARSLSVFSIAVSLTIVMSLYVF